MEITYLELYPPSSPHALNADSPVESSPRLHLDEMIDRMVGGTFQRKLGKETKAAKLALVFVQLQGPRL